MFRFIWAKERFHLLFQLHENAPTIFLTTPRALSHLPSLSNAFVTFKCKLRPKHEVRVQHKFLAAATMLVSLSVVKQTCLGETAPIP